MLYIFNCFWDCFTSDKEANIGQQGQKLQRGDWTMDTQCKYMAFFLKKLLLKLLCFGLSINKNKFQADILQKRLFFFWGISVAVVSTGSFAASGYKTMNFSQNQRGHFSSTSSKANTRCQVQTGVNGVLLHRTCKWVVRHGLL